MGTSGVLSFQKAMEVMQTVFGTELQYGAPIDFLHGRRPLQLGRAGPHELPGVLFRVVEDLPFGVE